jgi:heparan-alpha-glucosaminide N-acetyltransferase
MPPPLQRLASLDAYRGLIMLTLAAAGFGFPEVAKQFESSSQTWRLLAYHFDHPKWISQNWVAGCSYWDLIQPSFMFMVGVSMPFSYAARRNRGDGFMNMAMHAEIRSIVLVLLGIFLASAWAKHTEWIFTNVLAQIGLGYFFVFLLMGRPKLIQLFAATAILVCYWILFVFHDVPNATNFADHFRPDTNFAERIDILFLSHFPPDYSYQGNKGHYATLNFVPSMVTILFGVMAGELLQSGRSLGRKAAILFGSGILCMVLGLATGGLGQLGDAIGVNVPDQYILCPIVKRIWTPSWVLFSGAYCFWILGALFLVVDVINLRFWIYPLRIFGMNSILVYMMHQLITGWTVGQIKIHAGQKVFDRMSDRFVSWSHSLGASYGAVLRDGDYSPIMQSLSVLLVFWLFCWWLYRQRVFLRI